MAMVNQASSLERAQQLWNEWEIQCLVLVSFSLQVFLLFSAGFRKRYNSRVLSALLWLAYLSADSVAGFLLGRLTLLVGDDPRHQLPLFWAPFLLLHLGGQETITAFSMEDNTLWGRHLLNLATQVAMAVYVVGKQWRGDKQLVAPMVLVFILGTAKYAERIWALKTASSMTTGSRTGSRANKLPAYFMLSEAYSSHVDGNNEETGKAEQGNRVLLSANEEADSSHVDGNSEETGKAEQGNCVLLSANEEANSSHVDGNSEETGKAEQGNCVLLSGRLPCPLPPVPLPVSFASTAELSVYGSHIIVNEEADSSHVDGNSEETGKAEQGNRVLVLDGQAKNFKRFLEKATIEFEVMFNYFMDVTPSSYVRRFQPTETKRATTALKDSKNTEKTAYKLVEIYLSLIYDHLYTKFPLFYSNNIRFMGSTLYRLTTLCLSSVAVALFARAMADQNGRLVKYNRADVIISYILLVGATTLEIISLFLAFFSSYWAYKSIISFSLRCCVCQEFPVIGEMLLTIVSPESRREWSWKLPQHNIISECIQARQEASSGLLQRTMRWSGISGIDEVKRYSEVKRPLLVKLLDIVAAASSSQKWPDLTKFNGQWARWAVETMQGDNGSAAQKALSDSVSNIEGLDPVGSVIVWHIATDICWTDKATGSDEFRCFSRALSNYIMYLVRKCKVIGGSQGQYNIRDCRDSVLSCLVVCRITDRKEFIQNFREDTTHTYREELGRARNVSLELLRIEAAARWELIAMVWMEMLCYIAHNCAVGFHAKHLTTGGEFVSHVKVLLFILGIPFRLDPK